MTDKEIKNIKKKLIGKRFSFQYEEWHTVKETHTRYIDVGRVEVTHDRFGQCFFELFSKDGVFLDGVKAENITSELIAGWRQAPLLRAGKIEDRRHQVLNEHFWLNTTSTLSDIPQPTLFDEQGENI